MTYTPQQAYSAFGRMTLAFQALEGELCRLAVTLGNHAKPRAAFYFATELSFRGLCNVLPSVLGLRTKDGVLAEALRKLIAQAEELERARNSYAHSRYYMLQTPDEIVEFRRIKARNTRKRGYDPIVEAVDVAEVNQLADRMITLLHEVYAFCRQLAQQGVVEEVVDYEECAKPEAPSA